MNPIFTLVLLASSAGAAEMRLHLDLAYTDPVDRQRTLDVYAPAEGKSLPVAVWIHGGGWHRGDKSEVDNKPQALLDKGFVLVSINYRLFPTVTIKQIAGDVAKAIRWISDHIAEYGGDPHRLVVMGHSAGAQLAALICTDDRYLKAEGALSAVKACVPVDGDSYDVPMQIQAVEEGPEASQTLTFGDERTGETAVDHDPRQRQACGQLSDQVRRRGTAEGTIGGNLHRQGEEHSALPGASRCRPSGNQSSIAAARQGTAEAGIPAMAYPAAGKNHTTINADLGLPDDRATQELFAFLDKLVKRK